MSWHGLTAEQLAEKRELVARYDVEHPRPEDDPKQWWIVSGWESARRDYLREIGVEEGEDGLTPARPPLCLLCAERERCERRPDSDDSCDARRVTRENSFSGQPYTAPESSVDTTCTSHPICPYCGTEDRCGYEGETSYERECSACGNDFEVEVDFTPDYSTAKITPCSTEGCQRNAAFNGLCHYCDRKRRDAAG